MGWKETVIGGVSFMVALVTAVFQPQTEAFANSIIPDAGYYIVRFVFAIAGICVVAIIIHSVYVWRKRKPTASLDGKIMMERLNRMHAEMARDRVRDFFEERNQTMPTEVVSVPAEAGICRKTVLTIWVYSTTNWFEIGIENGKLIAIGKWKIREGDLDIVAPFKNYFHINHSKSKSLWIGMKVTFDLPRNKAICVLRKDDAGHIRVRIHTGFLLNLVGDYSYARTPNDKNEVTFPLEKM